MLPARNLRVKKMENRQEQKRDAGFSHGKSRAKTMEKSTGRRFSSHNRRDREKGPEEEKPARGSGAAVTEKEGFSVKYKAGDVVTLKVLRISELGAFLDAGTGNTSDDILLHKQQQTAPVGVGDEVEVYLYLDPRRRLTASMKLPKMREGQIGYAKVLQVTRDGGFVDIGAERGVFLPYTEMIGHIRPEQKVWVKLYRDKSGRPAVTMRVDKEMGRAARPVEGKKIGDPLTGTIYNITRDGFFLFTQERNIAFLHRSEGDPKRYLNCGDEVTGRITFIREDGHVDISLRKQKEFAMQDDMQAIMEVLTTRNGKMPYCDATPVEIIKAKFGISKIAFKRAVGHLMKEGRVYQENGWTFLKEPADSVEVEKE